MIPLAYFIETFGYDHDHKSSFCEYAAVTLDPATRPQPVSHAPNTQTHAYLLQSTSPMTAGVGGSLSLNLH